MDLIHAMNAFAQLGLYDDIVQAIKKLGFETPTPIQEKSIPHLLTSTQDLVAFAQTGTGKTGAFGLPAVHLTKPEDRRTQTLILCPTRELCIQISKDLANFAGNIQGIGVVAVYGGAPIDTQIRALKKSSQISFVNPTPASAAFSPLTITKSILFNSFWLKRLFKIFEQPEFPTTSPKNKILI